MVTFKVVLGFKDGKCVQKELSEEHSHVLLGKKLSDKVDGNDLGFKDYEFEISGGSDSCGFPMRKDVPGISRKRILSVKGTTGVVGWRSFKKGGKTFKKKISKGVRIRKSVCGNTIHEKISQVNLKILKMGVPLEGSKAEEASVEQKE